MKPTNPRLTTPAACLAILLALCAPLTSAGVSVTNPAPQSRSLVIFGASYAKGWGTPTLPGFDRVINRGVGGEETGDMLKRFGADVVATKPDAVLIWGHVNNITRAAPDQIENAKAAARQHYEEMLRQSRAAGIEVIFATEVPWTESGGFVNVVYGWIAGLLGKTSYATRVSGHVEEVNVYLRELCARNDLQLLDFGKTFADEDGTRRPEYAAEDGSHISSTGYQALSVYATNVLSRRH